MKQIAGLVLVPAFVLTLVVLLAIAVRVAD